MANYLLDAMSYLQPNFAGGNPTEEQPGNRNPLAWLIANRRGASGDEVGEDVPGEDDLLNVLTNRTPPPNQETPPTNLANTGVEGASPPSGQWSSWLEEPANRSFMMSMGLQLMTGGWGNIGQQLAQGLGAGLSAGHAQERIDRGEVTTGTGTGTGTGRGRARRTGGTRIGQDTTRRRGSGELIRRDNQLAEVEEFIGSNPTPEQWNAANQPGGLIYVAFGGPKNYEERNGLLHQVQETRRANPPPTNLGDLSPEELIALGSSNNPADQYRFDQHMRTPRRQGGGGLGSPGVGYRWGVVDGRVTRVPLTGEGGPRTGGGRTGGNSQIAQNTIAAMEAGIISLRDAREALSETNWAQRFVQGATGIGRMADLGPQLNRLARLPMHGVSGAQVNIPETQAYLDSFRPNPLDPRETWERLQFKLDNLEWMLQAMLAARRGGAVTDEAALELRNRMRERLGLRAITMERHRADQARVGGGTVEQPPAGQPPPVTPPPRTEQPPPTRQATGTREDPHVVQNPEEAARVPRGQFFRTPDGRLMQRQ